MMTRRNVELQLQALDVIERRHNSTASNSIDDGDVDPNIGIINSNVGLEQPILEQEPEEDLDDVIQEEMK